MIIDVVILHPMLAEVETRENVEKIRGWQCGISRGALGGALGWLHDSRDNCLDARRQPRGQPVPRFRPIAASRTPARGQRRKAGARRSEGRDYPVDPLILPARYQRKAKAGSNTGVKAGVNLDEIKNSFLNKEL